MSPSAQSPAPQRRTETLRSAILRGAFLIPLTLLIALGAITYFLARSTMTNQAIRSLETVAETQKDRVEAYVSYGDSSLALITSRSRLETIIHDYQLTRNPALRFEAVGILFDGVEATPDLTSVTVYDGDLEPLFYAGSVDDQPAIPQSFVEMAKDAPSHGVVAQTWGEGTVNLIGRPVFLDSDHIGVAVAGQSIEPLRELTTDTTGLGNTGETILLMGTEDGVEPILPLRFQPTAVETVEVVEGNLASDAVSGTELLVTEAIDYHGERVFALSRHIDSAGWGMIVLQDYSEVLAPLNTYIQVLGMALIAGVLLAYVAARRVADSVTAPVVKVAENAREVMRGRRDLTVETELAEIAFLVDSFNTMVSEMDDLTGDLERKIEERTQELTEKNAQLRQVMDDKEVFLAGVSHELRSPITAMIGFIDIVNMSGDDLAPDERAEMLETVSSQATDVLNLIEDLLASARAQAGTLKVATVRVNLAAQARQVIEATGQSSRHSVNFAGGDGNAVGDPARVRQIVRNLITNAVRYGGAEIDVGVVVEGNVATLQVRDNGDGVPEDERDKIFEAYGQASDARSVTDSVGLGLHVSRNLARLMGGDLDYEYIDGHSVFSLRLLKYVEDETGADEAASIVVSLGSD